MNKKKILLGVLIAVLVILLVIGTGFFMVLYDLKSSGNLFEVQVTIDPEPVRDFIVDKVNKKSEGCENE